MDILKGAFDAYDHGNGLDPADEGVGHDAPPSPIGQDERRMQVRAYNHWASLLQDRNFPAIEDLEPDNLPDFGPYSVLLDFSMGIENPGIAYLGEKLALECDADSGNLRKLEDVPSRSLLSRITDHYMQILANQAPIGFEAEFVNQRGSAIMYRGILLPFSSDDETIDFIYGVINWKELADAKSTDELLLEIDQALETAPESPLARKKEAPMNDWADGPGNVAAPDHVLEYDEDAEDEDDFDEDGDCAEESEAEGSYAALLPTAETGPAPARVATASFTPAYPARTKATVDFGLSSPAGELAGYQEPVLDLGAYEEEPETMVEMAAIDPAEMELGDWLAAARELAAAAISSEERTRNALYEAIARAYDFSIAAAMDPEGYEELVADAGLIIQERAPMTPVVKLVFGTNYDKTRLTEFATALGHAHRLQLPQGAMADYLRNCDGGLKGVVAAERRLRRQEEGKVVEPLTAPRQCLARKLRQIAAKDFQAIHAQGSEFALIMIRRTDAGEVVMLGEVPDDVALVERAAKRLLD